METLTSLSSSITTTHCHRETWQMDKGNLQKYCTLQPANLNGREQRYKPCNCLDPRTCELYKKDLADADM